MHLTPRRRAFLGVVVVSPLAYFYIGWTTHLLLNLALRLRGNTFVGCGAGSVHLLDVFNGCDAGNFRASYAVVEVLLMTLIAAGVTYGLARWVVDPIRQIADTVARFGPNALGLRLRSSGPRDETRQLSDAIDAMLDKLADGYQAQRRFASSASHELRTPLATQRALIEVSLSQALTEEQMALLSRQLLATNERNEKLIDGLLTLAETERGLMATASVRLDHVVNDAVDVLRHAATERDIDIDSAVNPITVLGEEALLDRLVSNLIWNAIKYNHRGGSVSIQLRTDGSLLVANTGPPVPPEAVAGLFEPFRRLSGERLDHGGGAGLGLTIARSIVVAHGGVIDARANPAGGMTIVVRVPALS